jgi:hypothetical protein
MSSASFRRLSRGSLLALGLLAGIAAHATHACSGSAETRWTVLRGLAVECADRRHLRGCLLRGLRVREERLAWVILGAAMLSWSGGVRVLDALHRPQSNATVPLARGRAVARLLPGGLHRAGADYSLPDPRVSEESVARWAHRWLAVASFGAALVFGAVLSSTGGDSTQIAINLAYPLGDMLLVAFVVSMFA